MRIPAVIHVSSAVFVAAMALVARPCQADGPLQFHTLSPCRLADTRPQYGGAGPMTDNTTRAFPVQGHCSVPVGAKAVALNVTAVAPTGQGHLKVFENGLVQPPPLPPVSTLNFPANVPALANGAIVALADVVANPQLTDQDLNVYARVAVASGPAQVDVILDVTGYFMPPTP
jgi:hypothetical protein